MSDDSGKYSVIRPRAVPPPGRQFRRRLTRGELAAVRAPTQPIPPRPESEALEPAGRTAGGHRLWLRGAAPTAPAERPPHPPPVSLQIGRFQVGVERNGDEVHLRLPGALRLIATLEQVRALIAALTATLPA